MIPAQFSYKKAGSLVEAIALIKESPDENKILAGGFSLIPTMKLRLAEYSTLVDISELPELHGISVSDSSIRIGACTTHYEVLCSEAVVNNAKCLSDAAKLIGDISIRNMGTIGGSIAHADPAADYSGNLLALNASVVVNDGSERVIPIDEFFTGFYETAKVEGEIITHIVIPVQSGYNSAYIKIPNPASRYPLVGCAVNAKISNGVCEDCRVAYSGFSGVPSRDRNMENAMKGAAVNADTINSLAANAGTGIDDILSDPYADEEYRISLAKTAVKRALGALIS